MSRTFINFTNHPSEKWEAKQRQAAHQYGEIVDVPFPPVSPVGDEAYIQALAEEYAEKICGYQPSAVLCQGEFTLAYQMVSRLKEKGILVLAACSERRVVEEKGTKLVQYEFEQFRQY